MIDGIASIVIPVTDHDRAISFYSGVLGFEMRADFTAGPGMRWVELTLPGDSTAIALANPRGEMWRSVGGDTNISLGCAGIAEEHARLQGAGIDVDREVLVLGHHIPRMFRLRDPDNNILQVVEHQ